MTLDKLWNYVQQNILTHNPGNQLFNFYNSNTEFDVPNGADIRCQNLRNYFESFRSNPQNLLVGEAPGWRGCRFSGIPFTSERILTENILPVNGLQSSTNHQPYNEASATTFWETILPFYHNVFVWNAIPFHPYEENNFLSNRPPTNEEINRYSIFFNEIIRELGPVRIIAIGIIAYNVLTHNRHHPVYVRHPSHGGGNEFRNQIGMIFQ